MNSLSTTAVFPLPRDFLHRAEEMLETNDRNIGQRGSFDLFNVVYALAARTEEKLYWPRFSLNEKVLLLCFLATAWEDIK